MFSWWKRGLIDIFNQLLRINQGLDMKGFDVKRLTIVVSIPFNFRTAIGIQESYKELVGILGEPFLNSVWKIVAISRSRDFRFASLPTHGSVQQPGSKEPLEIQPPSNSVSPSTCILSVSLASDFASDLAVKPANPAAGQSPTTSALASQFRVECQDLVNVADLGKFCRSVGSSKLKQQFLENS
jgi:hypothetical protein